MMRRAVRSGMLLMLSALLLMLPGIQIAHAEGFDFGLALEFVNATDEPGFEGGLGVQLGYEFKRKGVWNLGLQLHYFNGLTDDGDIEEELLYGDLDSDVMKFESLALHATARPERWPLLFKAGPVYASYRTVRGREHAPGFGFGAALVFGGERFRFHLLDYERYEIDGKGFNSFALSLAVFLGH